MQQEHNPNNYTPINSLAEIAAIIQMTKLAKTLDVTFIVIPEEHVNVKSDSNILQIYFEQMNVMAHQPHADNHVTPDCSSHRNSLPTDDADIFVAMDRDHIKPRITRTFL